MSQVGRATGRARRPAPRAEPPQGTVPDTPVRTGDDILPSGIARLPGSSASYHTCVNPACEGRC